VWVELPFKFSMKRESIWTKVYYCSGWGTGAVGEEILKVLEEQNFPVGDVLPLASARSAGGTIEFNGKSYEVEELTNSVFNGRDIDIAFFSAGGSISAEYAKYAVEAGAVVIDNTSYF